MTMQWDKAGSFPVQYEDVNVKAFFEIFARDLVGRLDLTPADRLLDIATGTGIVVRTARDRVPDLERIVGLDLSAAMLEVARDRAGDGIEFVEGDATQLPFADGEFTVLTCQQGLQFVPDRPAALAEFKRVTSGGGRIAVACWRSLDHQKGASAIADSAADLVPDLAAAAQHAVRAGPRRARRSSWAMQASTTSTSPRSRSTAATRPPQELVDGFATGTPLALVIPDQDAAAVAQWREKAIAALAPYETGDGLVLPMTTTLVTATSP